MQTALELACKSRLSFIRLAYFYRFLSLRLFVRHCTLKQSMSTKFETFKQFLDSSRISKILLHIIQLLARAIHNNLPLYLQCCKSQCATSKPGQRYLCIFQNQFGIQKLLKPQSPMKIFLSLRKKKEFLRIFIILTPTLQRNKATSVNVVTNHCAVKQKTSKFVFLTRES